MSRDTTLAERVGFEPTVSFPTHDFQSCRFGRSRTPPACRQASLAEPSTLDRVEPWYRARRSALRNGVPQTGSGPDGSSPQRTTPCAAGNLTVAPGTRLHNRIAAPVSSGPGERRSTQAFRQPPKVAVSVKPHLECPMDYGRHLRPATWEEVMTAMPCPVCGIRESLCDCLLRSARGNASDGAAVPGPAPSGVPSGGPRDVGEPGGFNSQAGSGAPDAGAGSEWADSLLQFVRDFASASPKAVPAPTGHPGRNQPVGRGPVVPGAAHQGTPGYQELAAGAVDGTSVPGPRRCGHRGWVGATHVVGGVGQGRSVCAVSERKWRPARLAGQACAGRTPVGGRESRVVRGRVRMAAGCRRRSLEVEAIGRYSFDADRYRGSLAAEPLRAVDLVARLDRAQPGTTSIKMLAGAYPLVWDGARRRAIFQ